MGKKDFSNVADIFLNTNNVTVHVTKSYKYESFSGLSVVNDIPDYSVNIITKDIKFTYIYFCIYI